jgi:hypothetical protein
MPLSEFDFLLAESLTIIVIIINFILAFYVGIRLYKRRKESPIGINDFYTGVFIFFITLAVSQLIFFYIDFFLTKFDPDLYYVEPGSIYYRVASLILIGGIGVFLIIIDRSILKNKFKGIFGFINIAIAILHLVYPINNKTDFDTLSIIGLIGPLIALIVPIIFIWLGYKNPAFRTISYLFAAGSILYCLSVLLFLNVETPTIILSMIFRIAGLLLLVVSATKLKL